MATACRYVVGDYNGHVNFLKKYFHRFYRIISVYDAGHLVHLGVTPNAVPFIYDVNGDSLPDLIMVPDQITSSILDILARVPHRCSPAIRSIHFRWDQSIRLSHRPVPGFASTCQSRENNSLVLYSGCQRGMIFKYAINQDSLRKGTSFFLTLMPSATTRIRSTVSIADINHDGTMITHRQYS